MANDEVSVDLVAQLADEFAARYRRGERPALSEYTAKYPELAQRIRDVFPLIAVMEEMGEEASASQTERSKGPSPLTPLSRGEGRGVREMIGGYRLLREIGRGGMGVVYEAEQMALGRHVALKVLPLGAAQAGGLERFRREARAAARLHHTNIVPVYEVGEDGDVCYYAMQFIQGQPLDQVVEELRRLRAADPSHPLQDLAARPARPVAVSLLTGKLASPEFSLHEDNAAAAPDIATPDTDPVAGAATVVVAGKAPSTADGKSRYYHSVARIGVQVAEALAYAHKEGVIHRDIKPSNLLLDTAGRVWVADFGLAKTEGDALTQSGDVIGTVPYMAPERFRGWADPRSDIYSLGLTLYEMLALRPAFSASDRGQLLLQASQAEPPRLRKIDPLIPRDLATIIAKATDKEPGQRYPTAGELAADLQRFLEDRPILARHISPVERAWRWCKRNPALAALSAGLVSALLLAALAVGGLVTGSVYNARLQDALDETEKARRRAEAARLAEAEARDEAVLSRSVALAHIEWRASNAGRADQLLEDCPQHLRHWEWAYLKRLCHTDLLTLRGQDVVSCVAISPGGQWIASAGWDRKVKIWDASSGQLLHTLEDHARQVDSLSFSSNGEWLASGDNDATIKLWEVKTGNLIRSWRMHALTLSSAIVAFGPDAKRLASGGADGLVKIWDAHTGADTLTLKGHVDDVIGVAWSPSGQRLASAGADRTLRIWDSATGRQLLLLEGHTAEVSGVAFSPNGKRLASASRDGTIRVSDAVTGQVIFTLGHGGTTRRVAFSPEGQRLAAAGDDGNVRIWDAAAGQLLHTLKGHAGAVQSIAFFPDGQRLVSGSRDKTVKVWDVALSQEASTLKGHTSNVRSVVFSRDGTRLASASSDRNIILWDTVTGQPLLSLKGHADEVWSVAFSPDGRRLASAGKDKNVLMWDTATGQVAFRLDGHVKAVQAVAFSADGRLLASGGVDRTVKLWDATTGRPILSLEGHKGNIYSLAFSPDGRQLASASGDRSVIIWDTTSGRRLHALEGHGGYVYGVAFSPDGQRLASASLDLTVKLWDVATAQELLTLKGHVRNVYGVAFSPDGKRLASASWDGDVKLWDLLTGREALTLKGHTGYVYGVAFSPDGTRLASAGEDHSVKVWDARPLTPETAAEREALGLLAFLFAKPLSRADVLEHLRSSAAMGPGARRLALTLAERYPEETEPERFRQASWAVARQPYLNATQYRFALRQAETAYRLSPELGNHATALGVAQYRAGRYQDAQVTLTKGDRANKGSPVDLALLAMTQHQLGQTQQAQATLTRLRETLKQPAWAGDAEAQGFLHEAVSCCLQSRASSRMD